MAASDSENPRRDEHREERPADPRYGYTREPVYRGAGEGRADEPGAMPPWGPKGQTHETRDEEHGSYGEHRTDPSHRFDPDYHEWRAAQMRQLDKDYALWRQERYRKFAEEFESWRQQRFSGAQRFAPSARANAPGPSYASAGRSGSAGLRAGPSFGDAGAGATPPVREPGALRPRAERGDRPEQADRPERLDKAERSDMPERDRGADRADRPDKPEKSGGLLSGLLGTGSSRK